MLDALENRWNSGYMRCIAHFRRMLAELPAPIVEQRLKLMALYLGATLSSRETAIEQRAGSQRLWGSAFAVDNLVDTVCGILQQPVADDTLAAMGSRLPR